MKQIEEPARRIPVRAEVDVLVVGAGPAGLMAAQAAALEKGTKVMLVESRGFLGGNMTIGLPLLGFLGRKATSSSRVCRCSSSSVCKRRGWLRTTVHVRSTSALR